MLYMPNVIEVLQQDWMIDSVKCFWQIQMDQGSETATINFIKNIWQHSKYSSFGGMALLEPGAKFTDIVLRFILRHVLILC